MANLDALDEALGRFATTGPEFGPGLSNHGPMATEALVALGRGDAVATWTDEYIGRLAEHPRARNRIDESNWREALGEIGRAGDWIAFFDGEVRARPWRELIETWTTRLAPGLMAGATHGILRTAHAVRTLAAGETPQRLHELAEGLGYWAARYQVLPGTPGVSGDMRVEQAIESVPMVPVERRRRGMIFDAVKAVEDVDFAPAINLVAVGDGRDVVSDITRTFVRHYLANAQRASIPFIHTVTAPSALRMLTTHLSDEAGIVATRYAWQACAAIYSTYGDVAPAAVPRADDAISFDEADLIEQAVAARDEHAIKFTEACLREYRLSSDPAFVAAARDVVVRLRRAG